ncbi:purine-binding chemotaxis protein CheW [Noviherbaspirillum humi]|uniref:Purine-binding chemotaxis protein CheW n=1 Tax=Noviherbaspirillum humi TaxID=1688639 RepID=A0A239JXY8_9BURK|nr:chemotaxis protein CheW [Noviherbaspirillum humi]SNT10856.1 purine-binding chemotaxis protein CheW [Noviherbaspirillum humi]
MDRRGASTQCLTFTLGGEVFGLAIMAVKEIISYPAPTPVPMMPDCVRGVMNLRGALVTVVDLARRLERTPAPLTRRTCVVVVETEESGEPQILSMVVDAVNAVIDIPQAEIAPAPAFGARIRPEFIAGVAKVEGRFIILLDIARVFSLAEIGAGAGAANVSPGP